MRTTSRTATVRGLAQAVRIAMRPGGPSMAARVGALPRLGRSVLSGRYSGTSRAQLGLMVAAVGYVLSPVDFVPEAVLPFIGLADDAFVLTWIASRFVTETESFLAWERQASPSTAWGATGDRPDGAAGGRGTRTSRARGTTVPGRVVR